MATWSSLALGFVLGAAAMFCGVVLYGARINRQRRETAARAAAFASSVIAGALAADAKRKEAAAAAARAARMN